MSEDTPDFSNVESGSSSTATKIYEANRDVLKDPDKIYPGQKLKIPPA